MDGERYRDSTVNKPTLKGIRIGYCGGKIMLYYISAILSNILTWSASITSSEFFIIDIFKAGCRKKLYRLSMCRPGAFIPAIIQGRIHNRLYA